jgi:hypothetical protein
MTKIAHDRPSGDIRDRDRGPEYRSTGCESTQPRVPPAPGHERMPVFVAWQGEGSPRCQGSYAHQPRAR